MQTGENGGFWQFSCREVRERAGGQRGWFFWRLWVMVVRVNAIRKRTFIYNYR